MSNRGFSIVELMIGLVIMALLIGAGTPIYLDYMNKRKVDGAVATIQAGLKYARVKAIQSTEFVILCRGPDVDPEDASDCNVGVSPTVPLKSILVVQFDPASATFHSAGIGDKTFKRYALPSGTWAIPSQKLGIFFNPMGRAWKLNWGNTSSPMGYYSRTSSVDVVVGSCPRNYEKKIIIYDSGNTEVVDSPLGDTSYTCP